MDMLCETRAYSVSVTVRSSSTFHFDFALHVEPFMVQLLILITANVLFVSTCALYIPM